MKLFREPLLHFVLLGALIFAVNAWREPRRAAVVATARIEVTAAFEFSEREPEDIKALFGREFAAQVATLREGAWSGPVASSYGLHLVRVEARAEPKPVALEAVRAAVVRDFNDERRRTANREIFGRLRERYQVAVDEAALTKAAAQPAKTVQR